MHISVTLVDISAGKDQPASRRGLTYDIFIGFPADLPFQHQRHSRHESHQLCRHRHPLQPSRFLSQTSLPMVQTMKTFDKHNSTTSKFDNTTSSYQEQS